MDDFFSLSPEQITLLATAIGLGVSKGYDAGEQNVLGNFFIQIGQTIVTVAAQQELLSSRHQKSEENRYLEQKIRLLQNEITLLEDKKR